MTLIGIKKNLGSFSSRLALTRTLTLTVMVSCLFPCLIFAGEPRQIALATDFSQAIPGFNEYGGKNMISDPFTSQLGSNLKAAWPTTSIGAVAKPSDPNISIVFTKFSAEKRYLHLQLEHTLALKILIRRGSTTTEHSIEKKYSQFYAGDFIAIWTTGTIPTEGLRDMANEVTFYLLKQNW